MYARKDFVKLVYIMLSRCFFLYICLVKTTHKYSKWLLNRHYRQTNDHSSVLLWNVFAPTCLADVSGRKSAFKIHAGRFLV